MLRIAHCTVYPPPPEFSDGLTPRRQGRATSLAWLLTAFALSCFAPANAIAQTSPPATLTLGTHSGIMLNLILPVTTADGKTYYYLDQTNNGQAGNSADRVVLSALDNLLNGGNDTDVTQEGTHDGSDDARSVIIGSDVLILPTVAELRSLSTDQSGTPPNWTVSFYAASNRVDENSHNAVELRSRRVTIGSDTNIRYVAFQVLLLGFGTNIIADQNYTVNQTVSVELPVATGGIAPLTYTLTRLNGSPILPPPTGLTFNGAARPPTITGAPTVVFATGTPAALVYTVTDANNTTTQLNFTLQVLPHLTFKIKAFLEGAQ